MGGDLDAARLRAAGRSCPSDGGVPGHDKVNSIWGVRKNCSLLPPLPERRLKYGDSLTCVTVHCCKGIGGSSSRWENWAADILATSFSCASPTRLTAVFGRYASAAASNLATVQLGRMADMNANKGLTGHNLTRRLRKDQPKARLPGQIGASCKIAATGLHSFPDSFADQYAARTGGSSVWHYPFGSRRSVDCRAAYRHFPQIAQSG